MSAKLVTFVGLLHLISCIPLDKVQQQQQGKDQPMQGFHRGIVTDTDWDLVAQNELKSALNEPQVGQAKNVIIFVGDGMGISTVAAARTYHAQSRSLTGYDAMLKFERFPYVGLSKAYLIDHQVADSAGSATAFLCGQKTRRGIIGLGQKVERGNCTQQQDNKLKSMLKIAMDEGKWAGVVTTTRITHATPAAAYAHAADRDWEGDSEVPEDFRGKCPDIAHQLVYDDDAKKFKVFLGGGRTYFLPNTTKDPEYNDTMGKRLDGKDLMQEFINEKVSRNINKDSIKSVWNKEQFDAVDPDKTEYLLGLFEPKHMLYEAERIRTPANKPQEPSLTEMVEKAVRILKRNPAGFVLLVEGGKIDRAHHQNKAVLSLNETTSLSDAVAMATDMTDVKDTLTVVTADHSHSFTYNGYPAIDANILGLSYRTYRADGSPDWDKMHDNKPYLIMGYNNGPGYELHRMENDTRDIPRKDLLNDNSTGEIGSWNYRYDSAMYRDSETHAGEDIAIYAQGPMSHLFHGVHEQNYIAHAMMYSACIGPNKDNCKASHATSVTSSLVVVVMTFVNCFYFLLR